MKFTKLRNSETERIPAFIDTARDRMTDLKLTKQPDMILQLKSKNQTNSSYEVKT